MNHDMEEVDEPDFPETERDIEEDDDDFDDDGNDGENYDCGDDDDDIQFADPGGRSSLRAASRRNPRNLPCPTCGAPNRLTPADRSCGYQCDSCADRAEGRMGYGNY